MSLHAYLQHKARHKVHLPTTLLQVQWQGTLQVQTLNRVKRHSTARQSPRMTGAPTIWTKPMSWKPDNWCPTQGFIMSCVVLVLCVGWVTRIIVQCTAHISLWATARGHLRFFKPRRKWIIHRQPTAKRWISFSVLFFGLCVCVTYVHYIACTYMATTVAAQFAV